MGNDGDNADDDDDDDDTVDGDDDDDAASPLRPRRIAVGSDDDRLRQSRFQEP